MVDDVARAQKAHHVVTYETATCHTVSTCASACVCACVHVCACVRVFVIKEKESC